MLWEKTKSILKNKLPESVYNLWIEPLECMVDDNLSLEIACPDRFFCSWVSENYLPLIKEILHELEENAVKVNFKVVGEERLFLSTAPDKGQLRLPSIPEAASFCRNLHPRYTFEEFMVGDSNALARSACMAIAENDNSVGPCLYINAGCGLGKSHLTHAVAHKIMDNSPGTQLCYLTAQQFSGEMVSSIKTNTMDQFKKKYHDHCDILLLEDIHTLTGKTKTQVELNEILDALIKSGKRIILTSALSPREIPNIDESFRSRMSAGLISAINPPDLGTRKLIIRRKAKNNNLHLSEDLVEYLAQNLQGDIRQVESAIVGLKAKSNLVKIAPDLDMVKEIVKSFVSPTRTKDLSVEIVRDFVAGQFKISVNDIKSKSRKKNIAFPRQVSMYLTRKLTDYPLADIGRAFNRDHSTVLHSVKVITEAVRRNGSIRGQMDFLAEKLLQ